MGERVRYINIFTGDDPPVAKRRVVQDIDADLAELLALQWAIKENIGGTEGHVFVRYTVGGYIDGALFARVLRAGEVTG